jgi:hypothetical protein
MGVFSVYCAICSGSLNRYELGSSHPGALKDRQARVARRVFWRNKGLGYYYDTDDEEKDDCIKNERLRCMQAADEHLEQASESGNSHEDGEEGHSSNDEDGEEGYSFNEDDELYSYDPGLLCEEDFGWLPQTGGLGVYNGHPKGPRYARFHSLFCRSFLDAPLVADNRIAKIILRRHFIASVNYDDYVRYPALH